MYENSLDPAESALWAETERRVHWWGVETTQNKELKLDQAPEESCVKEQHTRRKYLTALHYIHN